MTVIMDLVAHGLWAAAGATAAKRSTTARISVWQTVWWAVFPDVLAFGPLVAAAVWLRLAGRFDASGGFDRPPVHIGLPLYPAGHSVVIFLLVFGVVTALARRIVYEMLGWLLHILIDIPTHSYSYYATRFLWPVSDYRIDGIAWWTPWFWAATYAGLAVAYFLLWRKGWMTTEPTLQREARREHDAAIVGANTRVAKGT
jgi:hypothetical protein